jgi:hypothetical protein
MGVLGLCNFIVTCRFGVLGFLFVYFHMISFGMISLNRSIVCFIIFWQCCVGLLLIIVNWLSCINYLLFVCTPLSIN